MATTQIAAALAGLADPAASMAHGPTCRTILPEAPTSGVVRALTAADLAQLRDIGPVEPQTFAAPFFTLSPDGRAAAFQLRQAEPGRNAYCLAMAVLPLDGKSRPRLVDLGSEPVLLTFDFRGMAEFNSGLMKPITPRWSRDGRWIAFLKRVGGRTQVWRAFTDGSGSAPLTSSEIDVVDFRIAPDGTSIVFATRPDIEHQRRRAEQEGLSGWRYDDRFAPWISKRPMPRTPADRRIQVLEHGGQLRAATGEEAALLAIDRDIIAVAGAAAEAGEGGLLITSTDLAGGAARNAFQAALTSGRTVTCAAPECAGATSPWWAPGRRHVRFFRREGWARASTAIYNWDVATGKVQRLHVTEDLLSSCTPSGATLLCLVDSSLSPRRLVRLDPATGARVIVFDPNPEFAQLKLGQVERLRWRNAFGAETLGDLVYPVGYRKGRRYPLVIVQYDTRGFLRGGTGDEYPIQAFANRGYAVLSFSRPRFAADKSKAKSFEEAGRLDLEDFADRRSVQSSVEAGVKLLVDRGIADPRRLGITGFSDGSTTVEWALNHSSLFSAAALSSCCWDPGFVARVGPAAARHFLDEGYPGILQRHSPFWNDMALQNNARRITAPILVNASEMETLSALETYTALREAKVPIDLYVYPGEYHNRWQPAHRLATYRRSLDWFDYWLKGVRSDAPDRRDELTEWDRLRAEAVAASDRSQPGLPATPNAQARLRN